MGVFVICSVIEQDPEIAAKDEAAVKSLPEDLGSAIGRLMPFSDQATVDNSPRNPERTIAYELQDYLELVDWSGRAIIDGKRGRIPDSLPPILDRLKPAKDRSGQLRALHQPNPEKPVSWLHRNRQVDAESRSRLRQILPEGPGRSRGAVQSGLVTPALPRQPQNGLVARLGVPAIWRIEQNLTN